MSKAIAAAAINPLTILSVLSVQFSRRVAMALESGCGLIRSVLAAGWNVTSYRHSPVQPPGRVQRTSRGGKFCRAVRPLIPTGLTVDSMVNRRDAATCDS